MMTIYVLSGFNNYYNRIVKKFNSLTDYEPFITHFQSNYNFVPNDEVNTQVVLGSNVNNYDGTGDYLLAVNEDNTNEIASRWFIVESVKDRAGQFTLTLRRDLIADHYDQLLTAPMFIEKATLPISSSLIFNNEQMTYNQILKETHELKDNSECPWLVGYYAKNVSSLSGNIAATNVEQDGYVQIPTPIENWDYYEYATNATPYVGYITTGTYITNFEVSYSFYQKQNYKLKTNMFSYLTNVESTNTSGASIKFNGDYTQAGSRTYLDSVELSFKTFYPSWSTLAEYTKGYFYTHDADEVYNLLRFNNKVIRDSNGRFFEIKVSQLPQVSTTIKFESGSMFNALSNVIMNTTNGETGSKWFTGTPNASSFEGTFVTSNYSISIAEVTDINATQYNIPSTRNTTKNVPYDIFAIPYGEIKVETNASGTEYIMTNSQLALDTAMSMIVDHPTEIYDIQLLPYCPLPELITANKTLTVQNENQYSFITGEGGETNLGVIFNVNNSNFSINVPFTVNRAQSSIERKINNETKKYRLSSPNYSNYFDFSAEKNGGISYFNVDVSLKPYTPYIHINPDFNLMYGYDSNSPRGLICGGDFSLTQVTNQWEQYQVQNKNYQNTFDRQIQNMEVTQKYQRVGEVVGAITGVGAGAAAGALAGSSIMPGIGTAAGALAGGVTSLAGGIADVAIGDKLRHEALDYTRDLFGYQLGNIQALPQTISKVSAFNLNNKIFPVLEIYEATEEEVQALVNKMAYNGMTVMVIGKLTDYFGNDWSYNGIESQGYIKGKLIKLETINDDYHIVNAISGELDKGVYIK